MINYDFITECIIEPNSLFSSLIDDAVIYRTDNDGISLSYPYITLGNNIFYGIADSDGNLNTSVNYYSRVIVDLESGTADVYDKDGNAVVGAMSFRVDVSSLLSLLIAQNVRFLHNQQDVASIFQQMKITLCKGKPD